jgi:hypothetical protein
VSAPAIPSKATISYITRLREVREKKLAEFRKRDDAWLMAVDKNFGWGPTNNLVVSTNRIIRGKSVCSRGRAPGAKPENG